jgi:hypothetical protein
VREARQLLEVSDLPVEDVDQTGRVPDLHFALGDANQAVQLTARPKQASSSSQHGNHLAKDGCIIAGAGDQIGGSRSLPESRIVTLRCRLAVVQCVHLPGQER